MSQKWQSHSTWNVCDMYAWLHLGRVLARGLLRENTECGKEAKTDNTFKSRVGHGDFARGIQRNMSSSWCSESEGQRRLRSSIVRSGYHSCVKSVGKQPLRLCMVQVCVGCAVALRFWCRRKGRQTRSLNLSGVDPRTAALFLVSHCIHRWYDIPFGTQRRGANK